MENSGPSAPEEVPKVEKALQKLGFYKDLLGALTDIAAEVYLTTALHPYDRLVKGDLSRFKGMEHSFFEDASNACKDNFGVELITHGDVRPCAPDERMLLMGNHPTFEAEWVWGEAVSHLAENIIAMGKKNLLWEPWMAPPLFAWVGKLAGKLGFVSRNNHEEAVASVRNACKTVFVPGSAMILLTDKHRFTPENSKNDREKFSKLYPGAGIESWMKYTGMPSSSGVMEVVDAVANVRLINVTSGLDRPEPHGAKFHVLFEEVEHEEIFRPENIIPSTNGKDVSERELMLRGWQLKDYERKNGIVSGWQINK